MQCIDCEYVHSLTDSSGRNIDICINAESGAYLEITGICGWCEWDLEKAREQE